jgi:hypothetical protein
VSHGEADVLGDALVVVTAVDVAEAEYPVYEIELR